MPSRPKFAETKLCEILWHTVIVGRGTAAAAVADNLAPRDDRDAAFTVVAIGKSDPWKGDRGQPNGNDPSGFLNQSRSTTKHTSRPVTAHADKTMKTVDWAAENELVLEQGTDLVYDAKVKNIVKVGLPPKYKVGDIRHPSIGRHRGKCFEVTLEDDRLVHARRIVLAAGAGPDRLPEEQITGITLLKQQMPSAVYSVTEFAKLGSKELNRDVAVIVIGPNAAIDAVNKALHYSKCKVHWLLSGPPAILDTQPLVKKNEKEISVYYQGKLKVNHVGAEITISGSFKDAVGPAYKQRPIRGQYIVYGLGPDPTPVANIIDESIRQQLELIRDKNHVFSDAGDAILGLSLPNSDEFLVVGALASQMVSSRDRQTLKDAKEVVDMCQKEVLEVLPNMADLSLTKDPDKLVNIDPATLRVQLKGEQRALEELLPDGAAKTLLAILVDLMLTYVAAKKASAKIQSQFRIPTKRLTSTIADSGQISSIIAVIRALPTTNRVPSRIGTQTYQVQKGQTKAEDRADVISSPGQADWNNDVEDDLAIYIALKYPFAPERKVNEIMLKIEILRKRSATGFDDATVLQWERELERAHADGLREYRDAHRELALLASS